MNDLPDDLSLNVKLFADDTPLFSTIHDTHSCTSDLNKGLKTTNEWVFQQKMKLILIQIIHFFTRKPKNIRHPPHIFDNTKVFQSTKKEHLGLIIDLRLSFEQYLAAMEVKASNTMVLLRKIQHILLMQALIAIYKAF